MDSKTWRRLEKNPLMKLNVESHKSNCHKIKPAINRAKLKKPALVPKTEKIKIKPSTAKKR